MKKIGLVVLKVLISLALVFLVIKLSNIDLVETYEQLKSSKWQWFMASCILFLATIATNNYRWCVLANLLNYKLDFFTGLKMYFEGAFSNNFLPTNFGGDALRAYDLGKQDKQWLRAASTVIMERLYGFFMMFLLMPIALILEYFSPQRGSIPQNVQILLWSGFAGMILWTLSYPIWSKIPLDLVQKIRFAIEQYLSCHKSVIKVVVWTVITHIFFIAGNITAGLALDVGITQIPIWYWFIVVPTSTLLGFIVPAVKGVGAKEASYIYLLGLIGIESNKSLAIAFMVFLATTVATLPGLTIVFRKKAVVEQK